MSLRIRRGTDAQRATTSLDMGELVYTTDTKQLYVGNGIDAGGSPVIRLGTGLAWADPACTTIIATGAALQVSADATPSLGGNLSLNSYTINGTGSINIAGDITSGSTTVDGTLRTFNRTSSHCLFNSLTGTGNTSFIEIQVSRGTFAAPTAVVSQDLIGGIILRGYTGSVFAPSTVIGSVADGVPVNNVVPGKFVVQTVNATGTGINLLTFDKNGTLATTVVTVGNGTVGSPSIAFSADTGVNTGFYRPSEGVIGVSTNGVETAQFVDGGISVTGYVKVKDFAGTLPLTPTAGMIVLDGSIFKGYNGTAWVDLN
jgi:hypothetical protein